MADQAALFPFIMATVDDVVGYCDRAETSKSNGEGPNLLDRPKTDEKPFPSSGAI